MPIPIYIILLIALICLFYVALISWSSRQRAQRQIFINRYVFTAHQFSRVQIKYPHLNDAQLSQVSDGLKVFFSAHLASPIVLYGMPSKAVDELWHAFVLDTRAYHSFCESAFGQYFHHVPSSRMSQAHNSEFALIQI